jgi:hypothetical protein
MFLIAGDCMISITDPCVTVIPITPNPVCANLLMRLQRVIAKHAQHG